MNKTQNSDNSPETPDRLDSEARQLLKRKGRPPTQENMQNAYEAVLAGWRMQQRDKREKTKVTFEKWTDRELELNEKNWNVSFHPQAMRSVAQQILKEDSSEEQESPEEPRDSGDSKTFSPSLDSIEERATRLLRALGLPPTQENMQAACEEVMAAWRMKLKSQEKSGKSWGDSQQMPSVEQVEELLAGPLPSLDEFKQMLKEVEKKVLNQQTPEK